MGCTVSQEVAPKVGQPLNARTRSSDERPVLYVWPGSAPCRAVLLTLGATRLDCRIQLLDIFKQEHKTPAFLKISPDGSIPVFVDGSNIICESKAIMKAVVEKQQKLASELYPEEIEIRCLVNKYLDFEKDTVYPAISEWIYPQVFARITPDNSKLSVVKDVLSDLNSVLALQTFIAADHVTLADFSVIATVTLLELVDWDFGQWTEIERWRTAMKNLEYFAMSNKGLEDWKFYIYTQQNEE